MQHKNDYTCIVHFCDGTFKKWTYVHSLFQFNKLLETKHPNWDYINVYERRSQKFITRFYIGDSLPHFLN